MKFLCPNCQAKYRIGPEKLVGRQVAKIRCRKCEYRIQLSPRPGSDEYDITATPTSMALPGAGAAAVTKALAAPPSVRGAAVEAPAQRPVSMSRSRAAEREDAAGAPATKKPTAAVPGLPGLGVPRAARATREGPRALEARRPGGPQPPTVSAPLPLVGPAAGALAPAAHQLAAPPLQASAGLPSAGSATALAVPSAFVAPTQGPLPLVPPPPPLVNSTAAGSLQGLPLPPLGPAPVTLTAPQAQQAVAPPPSPAPARPAASGTQLGDQFRQSLEAGGSAGAGDEGPHDGWFVGVNGVPLGPIPVGDLKELAAAGHVDRRSLVWREGQAEWKPLGKFPQLARLLDDGTPAPSVRPGPPEREPSAPAARANGASDSPSATGFDVRPVLSTDAQRPSVWGDLDDEDDGQEQPTTVKGRVSVSPNSMLGAFGAGGGVATGAFPVIPALPPPPTLRAEAGSPSSAIGSGPASSTAAVSISPGAPEGPLRLELGAAIAEPTEDAEARALRSRGKGRIYAVAIVMVASLVLGWTLRHVLWPGPAVEPRKPSVVEPARTLAAPAKEERAEPTAAPAPPPEPAKADEGEGEPPIAQAATPALPTPSASAPALSEPSPSAPAAKPALVVPAGVSAAPPAQASPGSDTPSSSTGTSAAKPLAPTSLLSGLGAPQTPGPGAGQQRGDAHAASTGLDATAIQRTVHRYSPAVRQNCWQRALNARAPGVPSSAKVTATITVDSAGHVQSVSATGAPRGYPGLAHCIEEAVKSWQFPRAGAETVTSVPFMFLGQ